MVMSQANVVDPTSSEGSFFLVEDIFSFKIKVGVYKKVAKM